MWQVGDLMNQWEELQIVMADIRPPTPDRIRQFDYNTVIELARRTLPNRLNLLAFRDL